ncbi:MAG: alginate lyase family protein [Acidobacteriota bacterium]
MDIPNAVTGAASLTRLPLEWVLPRRPPASRAFPLLSPLAADPAVGVTLDDLDPTGETWMPVVGPLSWTDLDDWTVDPVSGHDFGRGASRLVRARPDLPDVDLLACFNRCRMGHVLHAAQVSAISSEHRQVLYCEAFAKVPVDHFNETAPPGTGPAWSNAMEVALRATRLLHAAAWLGERADASFETALLLHESWLSGRSDWRGPWTGNHHLVELAGRFLLAACLAPSPERERTAARTWRGFWREFSRQIRPDGLHFESSTGYHLLVMDAAVQVFAVGWRQGRKLSQAHLGRLVRAAESTAELTRDDGSVAALGDSDDAVFCELPGRPRGPFLSDARSLLGCLAVAVASPRCARLAGEGASVFGPVGALFGAAGLDRLRELREREPESSPRRRTLFWWSGLGVLREGSTHVTVSALGTGRAGTGGHSHDDAGGFELWRGRPWLVDSGTGSYTGDVGLRQLLRGVTSHSVVQVGERETSVGTRVFRRNHQALPRLEIVDDEVVGVGHHGFAQGPGKVMVWRRLQLTASGLVVEDELTGRGEHELTWRWHWAPDLTVEETETGWGVRSPGGEELRLELGAVEGAVETAVRGQVEWTRAPRQGETVSAPSVELRVRARLPARLSTLLTW